MGDWVIHGRPPCDLIILRCLSSRPTDSSSEILPEGSLILESQVQRDHLIKHYPDPENRNLLEGLGLSSRWSRCRPVTTNV